MSIKKLIAQREKMQKKIATLRAEMTMAQNVMKSIKLQIRDAIAQEKEAKKAAKEGKKTGE